MKSLQAASKAQRQQLVQLRGTLRARDATIASQQAQIAALQNEQGSGTTVPTTPTTTPTNTTPTMPTTTAAQTPVGAESFGDGLYQVGADIQPGQYRAEGGSACYWAKLTSSDVNSVVVNNLSDGPQTVAIDSAYFVSDGCGTWTKVG